MPIVEGRAAATSIYCPVVATMDLLNQKWTLHIIRELMSGKKRFNELAHRVGGCNSRTLRERLRSLEEEEIVVRHVVNTIPPWVEYELTDKGHSLNSVIESIASWGLRWMSERVSRCEESVKANPASRCGTRPHEGGHCPGEDG